MSKNSEHNVKIVWDDPAQEVTIPPRDFKSLNRRVIRRKWLVRWLTGTIISMMALGVYVLIILSDKPKNVPETPNFDRTMGPMPGTEQPLDWSAIDTIEQEKSKEPNSENQVLDAQKENSFIEESTKKEAEPLIIKKENDITQVTIDTAQISDQSASETELGEEIDSTAQEPVKSFIPSEFIRAYPTVGYDSLYRYLTEYINKELFGSNNEADTLKISFAIEVDGHPSGIKLSINTSDSIFMRIEEVVENMPAWQPATADGQPIKTRFRLPLIIQSKTIKEE